LFCSSSKGQVARMLQLRDKRCRKADALRGFYVTPRQTVPRQTVAASTQSG
jgi:hypothetical protein